MFARFLEVSVSTGDIAESVTFYETLGFRQLSTGETWDHPYGVFSDGNLHVGIHQYEFHSPSLTFVRPYLANELDDLRARGIHFEFAKTGDDEFNEAGFFDPGGQMVTMLEARTYSPASERGDDTSLLGHLDHLALPATEIDESTAFWFRLGFDDHDSDREPDNQARIVGDGLRIGLYQGAPLLRLAAVYVVRDVERRIALLEDAGFHLRPNRLARDVMGVMLTSPEGLDFLLQAT